MRDMAWETNHPPNQTSDYPWGRNFTVVAGNIKINKSCCTILRSTNVVVEKYLKASPLPPAPLAVAGFMVAGLAAWQYSDRLAGLLGFAVWVLFC